MTKRVAVVGQGVIGLTSAVRLLTGGFQVDVFSKEPFAATNSMSAGAYWWPHKTWPQNRVEQWARRTYDEYTELQHESESGVHFEKHYRFCIDPDDSAYVLQIIDDWQKIDGADYGISCHEAFLVTLPVIDVPIYMPWLKAKAESLGARFFDKEIASPAELLPEYDLVVNCTGVGARTFVDDPKVFPIRGQIVRASLPEGMRESTRLYQKQDEFTLVLPRKNDVVLGGTSGEGDWDRTPRESDTEKILQRCTSLVPRLSKAKILDTAVGLRPGRDEVRLEIEDSVIHNYGHGGGGYTVAWGCADEVLDLAREYFR